MGAAKWGRRFEPELESKDEEQNIASFGCACIKVDAGKFKSIAYIKLLSTSIKFPKTSI